MTNVDVTSNGSLWQNVKEGLRKYPIIWVLMLYNLVVDNTIQGAVMLLCGDNTQLFIDISYFISGISILVIALSWFNLAYKFKGKENNVFYILASLTFLSLVTFIFNVLTHQSCSCVFIKKCVSAFTMVRPALMFIAYLYLLIKATNKYMRLAAVGLGVFYLHLTVNVFFIESIAMQAIFVPLGLILNLLYITSFGVLAAGLVVNAEND